ncbi:tetratricopeptide repeat protein [Alteromonas sp. ASW11-130]|uniref:tetratricopeptide repeat protein n=1 Tax=Alteromonas sp. ASW11-130 TaxID=3015775 RepID=UPI002242463E|nr:tetratricopeptide repeat protein [Alteromonas sp. ASW11-130]MCW8092622.1 tetratricopeptide repeat protein [Alteromonas sp. ASW11-130]
MNRILNLFLSICLLCACVTTPDPSDLSKSSFKNLDDNLFPSYKLFKVETKDQIFALNEGAKLFVDRIKKPSPSSAVNTPDVKKLVENIFDHTKMGLSYRNNANSTASETFDNRTANCLSLSIMTFAMAKYAGLDAAFYVVDIPEYWVRQSGFDVLNGHINLKISPEKEPNSIVLLSEIVDVDFDPQDIRNQFPRKRIAPDRALAMFYVNKGAEALMQNSYSKAYAYFREAVLTDPEYSSTWTNLGVLFRINGYYEAAEKAYRHSLALDESNWTAWENLAYLMNRTDRKNEGNAILNRLKRLRLHNPFYHQILGEKAFEKGEYAKAIRHYRNGLKLDRKKAQILFGLGKSYYAEGNINKAAHYLSLAARFAPNKDLEKRYQSKLSLLQTSL